jgi:hypothetical protein
MQVRELVSSRWAAIRKVAGGHGVDRIRWWPPTHGVEGSADFLVDGELGGIRELRADLEQALGCKVGIYLTHADLDALSAESLNLPRSSDKGGTLDR